MPKRIMIAVVVSAIRLAAAGLTAGQRQAIDKIIGSAGTYTAAEDTYRLNFARGDAKVTVDGTAFHPFMGLTSSAAFKGGATGSAAILTADLALFEDEVNPAMSAASEQGLEVTGLRNHFFFENPRVMFMHLGGSGPVETLAAGLRKALDTVSELRRVSPEPTRLFAGPPVAPISSIDAGGLNGILRVYGQTNGGMYKATFPRTVTMHGQPAGGQMGVATWVAFFGSMGLAFVDGSFACTNPELQPVLKALRRRGINIVAIDQHLPSAEPPLVFLHFWAKGRAAELAVAVRAVLDEQSKMMPAAASH